MNTELQDRLSALYAEVPADVEAQHLGRISAALAEPPAPIRVRAAGLRRRAAAVAGAVALVATPAAAVAAEAAVPGDVLYPVKQATELVRSWFDETVEAEHRIDELETVIERGAGPDVVEERLRDAEDAVAVLDDPDTTERLDRIRDRVGEETTVSDEPAQDRSRERDQAPSTTTAPGRTDAEPPPTTSTTTPPADRSGDTAGSGEGGSTDDPPGDGPPRGDRGGSDRRGD